MIPPRPALTIIKLSDHFGQYVLTLQCSQAVIGAAHALRRLVTDVTADEVERWATTRAFR
jgi:hypothetical protein